MKILLANPRGFCAGVYMAIDVVEQLLDVVEDELIYVFHEIVHNKHVVQRFVDRGVVFIESINDVPEGAILVFSAHGVSPIVRERANKRSLIAIDATCPLVTKVHAEAIRYAARGWQILLIGHEDHQEVIGTRGEVPESIQIVDSTEAISSLRIDDPEKLIYLTQTTLSMDDASVIIRALREAFPAIHEPPSDDICYATTNRQLAVRQLAPQCQLVIVVGSRNSSNSQRLRELAEATGTPAVLVDDHTELSPSLLEGVDNILVTAGASAPEDLVQRLMLNLIKLGGGNVKVEQHDVFHENVEFGLPGTLKKFMRSRGINPDGRRIAMDNISATTRFLTEQEIQHSVVDVTIGAST